MTDIGHDLFRLGDWTLQQDTIDRQPIASIRHHCDESMGGGGYTIWFNSPGGIAMCYCGALVPEEVQGLCVLFNLEWVQGAKLNG